MSRSSRTLASLLLCLPLLVSCNSMALERSSVPGAQDPSVDELDDYDESIDGSWVERSFSGNTSYHITKAGDTELIRGQTNGAASVLYRAERVDVSATPIIEWQWKVSNTYNIDNEQSRDGDDFPARIYVVVQTGLLPWESHAINYVWSSDTDAADSWLSPYTESSMMIPLRKGAQQKGRWATEKRNIVTDFKRYFDMDIEHIDGYAFMVDGDNTGSSGTGWLRGLRFSEN